MSELPKDNDNAGISHQFEEGLDKKFEQFRKSNAPAAFFTLKITEDDHIVQVEHDYPNAEYEDIIDDLPDSEPRFIVHSFKWERPDGRIQYPLVLIFYSPLSCPTKYAMLYSSAQGTISRFFKLNKCIELRDPEDLDKSFIISQLGKIR